MIWEGKKLNECVNFSSVQVIICLCHRKYRNSIIALNNKYIPERYICAAVIPEILPLDMRVRGELGDSMKRGNNTVHIFIDQ